MKSAVQLRTAILSSLITLALVFFVLLPRAQAVTPAPDGGYPNANTAEGQNALQSTTTGGFNAAVGYFSLFANTTGSFNTAVGAAALDLNTADKNTATGAGALLSNTTGGNNTANGAFALFGNTAADDNTAIGAFALQSNTIGYGGTALGYQALASNTIGYGSTAVGYQALASNTGNPTGAQNTAIGYQALYGNTIGYGNTATGNQALFKNTTGLGNTAYGNQALLTATGNGNTGVGANVLFNNGTGTNNTAVGSAAMFFRGGSYNTALGDHAGAGNSGLSGNNNVYIGAGMTGVDGESNACYIASIFGQTSANGIPVLINSNHKLGTVTSSKRFKEDIKPMDKASEALFALKPVCFRYKKEIDPVGISQLGLVAEDVEKVNPDLVVRDKEGKPYSVRYDQVNAMLLNEFLKEHRKVEKLTKDFESKLAQQQKQIEALTAGLQKVSAQLEASKPAPQVVNNP